LSYFRVFRRHAALLVVAIETAIPPPRALPDNEIHRKQLQVNHGTPPWGEQQ
jgi:hypothetical protein